MPDQRDEKPSYGDENISETEKESGHTRLPLPNEEGKSAGLHSEASEKTLNPDRPDEFGDGDRRS